MRRTAAGPSKGTPLTSKPLCSCKNCTSKKCPNILDKIKIPTVEHAAPPAPRRLLGVSMKPKGKKKRKLTPPSPALALPPEPKETDSLLEVLRKGRECGCDVVTRAAAGSLHRLAGLQDRREGIIAQAHSTEEDAYYNPADDPDADEYSCEYRPPFLEEGE